jgi:pimeloyl-ACP methyl ester carboxylesterase
MSEVKSLDVADGAGVFVKVAGGEVHVVVDGDPADPAVACVHGVPGGTRDFRVFAAEAKARGLCVVRLDLPGFGRSPPSPTLLAAPEQRAALLVEVMRARGHARFAVVGHSFGGTTALATAALHPSSVTALVMVNSVGVTRHRGLQAPHELIGQVKHLAKLPLVGDRLLDTLLKTYARLGLKSEKPLERDDVVAHTELIGGLDFADLRAFAARVTAPALVASSRDDRLVEPLVSFTLAAALTSSPLETHRHKQGGAHFLQKHDAAAIASWLAARLGSRA